MSAHDHLPAHLVPASQHPDTGWRSGSIASDPDTLYQQRPARRLTIGTPASEETRLLRTDEAMAREVNAGSGRRKPNTADAEAKPGWEASGPQQPPIVTIRQAGPHASELYVRTGDGQQLVVVPLSYGTLVNLLEDATAALRRCEETR